MVKETDLERMRVQSCLSSGGDNRLGNCVLSVAGQRKLYLKRCMFNRARSLLEKLSFALGAFGSWSQNTFPKTDASSIMLVVGGRNNSLGCVVLVAVQNKPPGTNLCSIALVVEWRSTKRPLGPEQCPALAQGGSSPAPRSDPGWSTRSFSPRLFAET